MQQSLYKAVLACFLCITTTYTKAQGCSDAGFCTISSLKPNINDTLVTPNNQIKIGISFGSADNAVMVWGNFIEYNRQLSKKWGIDLKVTSLSQNGNGISTLGLSDVYLTTNFKASKKLKIITGVKAPLTNGNRKKNSLPLPMDYQSSLGTFDLILGLGYQYKKLQILFGYQQPLTQNKNEFTAENYPPNSLLRSFQSTRNFKRSNDILLRISYPFKLNNKLKFTPSLLPIYHLTNDKFTTISGEEKEIIGSQGLTLNGNAFFDYEINSSNAIQINAGMPFIFRDARPDGLTRHFVLNMEYKVKF